MQILATRHPPAFRAHKVATRTQVWSARGDTGTPVKSLVMRCVGIDYGTKRIGLAFGDDLGVATPLPALVDSDEGKRWIALRALIEERGATDIVIGYPLNMDDSAGAKAKEVAAFASRLREATALPVHLIDERLTSYEAESSIPKNQRRAVRASGLIDSRAATLILQDFLDQRVPLIDPKSAPE